MDSYVCDMRNGSICLTTNGRCDATYILNDGYLMWKNGKLCESESTCNIDKKYIPKPFTCKSLL